MDYNKRKWCLWKWTGRFSHQGCNNRDEPLSIKTLQMQMHCGSAKALSLQSTANLLHMQRLRLNWKKKKKTCLSYSTQELLFASIQQQLISLSNSFLWCFLSLCISRHFSRHRNPSLNTQQNILKRDWNCSSHFSRLFNDKARISRLEGRYGQFLRAPAILSPVKPGDIGF